MEITSNSRIRQRVVFFILPLLILGLCQMAETGCAWVASKIFGIVSLDPVVWTFVSNLISIALCALAMKVGRLKPVQTKTGLSDTAFAVVVLLVVIIQVFGGATGEWMASLTNDASSQEYSSIIQNANLYLLALTALVSGPIAEEFMMRGILYNCWSRVVSPRFAAYASAIVFALIHMTIMHLYFAFALGLILAFIYQATKKLRWSIGAHMLFNTLGLFAGGIFSEATKTLMAAPQVLIAVDIVCIICIELFLFRTPAMQPNAQESQFNC